MRLLKVILSACLISLALFNPALTEEGAEKGSKKGEDKIGVVKAVICKEVKDLSPVCESDVFPADIGKLYCFTRVTGGKREILSSISGVTRAGHYSSLTFLLNPLISGLTAPRRSDLTRRANGG
jgi:hypothetical protein